MNDQSRNVDKYITAQSPEVQAILRKIRVTIRKAAPKAEETISYKIPAFILGGRILIYYAAFKNHIGIYPPVRGDEKLTRELAPYKAGKGNLKFPLDEPIPYPLISRIVRVRAKEI